MNSFNWDLRNLTVQTHSGLRGSDIKRQLTDWRHLEGLDDRCLWRRIPKCLARRNCRESNAL
jgi:hypothetical protein